MKDSIEVEEYRGLFIHIKSDEDAADPRKEWDNAGTMVCWHNRYSLGDEQPDESAQEYLNNLAYEINPQLREQHEGSEARIEAWETTLHEYRIARDAMEAAQAKRVQAVLDNNYVILPLYLYDHSGITMSTGSFSCPWDSGQVGFIYISHKDILKEWGDEMDSRRGYPSEETIKRAADYLTSEVSTYDDYLTGAVYGYVIMDAENEDEAEDNHIDSCWGFYGYDNKKSGLMEMAKNAIDCHISSLRTNHFKQLKTWIRNRVPHHKRTACPAV